MKVKKPKVKTTFDYCDRDCKCQHFPVTGTPAVIDPATLKVLTNETLRSEGAFHDRSFSRQASNWFIVEPNNKTALFHERAYFSFEKSLVEYWLCDCDFPTPQEAMAEILKRGCDPLKFYAQQHFYSQHDGDGSFIVTTDFDEALKFLGYRYEGEKEKRRKHE